MNVDVKIKATPALARKLLTLRSIQDFDMCPDLVALAGEDLVTDDLIRERIPDQLREMANVNLLAVTQHAVDWNHRFILPTLHGVDATIVALATAFYSGKKAMVVGPNELELKMFMMKLKFCSTRMLKKDEGTSDEDVLFCALDKINDDITNFSRERVVVLATTPTELRASYCSTSPLMMDYPHVISAMTLKPKRSLIELKEGSYDVGAISALNSAMMWYHPSAWTTAERNLDAQSMAKAAMRFGAYLEFSHERN